MFRRATGRTPDSAPAVWDAWRTEQVTRLVREIHAMVRAARRPVQLSAAVGASPEEARRRHHQDSLSWIRQGLIDAVYPMNYSEDTRVFARRVRTWSTVALQIPVVVGVMFDKRYEGTIIEQVRLTGANGPQFAAFAYNSLFERLDRGGRPIRDAQSSSRAALRGRVIPYLRRLAVPAS